MIRAEYKRYLSRCPIPGGLCDRYFKDSSVNYESLDLDELKNAAEIFLSHEEFHAPKSQGQINFCYLEALDIIKAWINLNETKPEFKDQ